MGAIARRHDPDRFLCALFAPAAAREALFTLIAFNHELARAREVASQPMLALIRLQWWRDAIEAAAAGRPPLAHEVARPLHALIRDGVLPPPALLALVDAREVETEETIPTSAAFEAYLRGTAGGLAVLSGAVLGAPDPFAAALLEAGALYGLAGVLRSGPALARHGRRLLPTEAPALILARAGLARVPAGRAALHGLPRAATAAALPLVLAGRDLQRLAAGRDGPAPRGVADRLAVVLAGLRGMV